MTISNNDMIAIDFWAEWCGPCKMFDSTFGKVSENQQSIVFAKCDTEKQQKIAEEFGIQSILTLAIMCDKILLFSQLGAILEGALEDLVSKAKELNMAEVHNKIAEQKDEAEVETTKD